MSSHTDRPRSTPRHRLAHLALSATIALAATASLGALAGCTATSTPAALEPDLSFCRDSGCGGCASDGDCQDGKRCDPASGACVGCLADRDCAAGQVCAPSSHSCTAGCSPGHGCGDSGVCERDAGACVACLADTDCTDAARPRCDVARNTCAPCLPLKDNCGPGTYCAPLAMGNGGGFVCAAGCKDNSDCVDDTGDGGAAIPDGGAAPLPALLCDVGKHQCVQCFADDSCPAGTICTGGQCTPGCTESHACAPGRSCCAGVCSDVSADNANCGACGNACQPGAGCCGATCVDFASSLANCGACGSQCAVANGTPSCRAGACVVAACAPGWNDCDQQPGTGCETHVDVDTSNCGACGAACALANAAPRCFGGRCTVASCTAPWADCNGDPSDGCETDLNVTLSACGACKRACVTPHATPVCTAAACLIQACDAGFADCNSDAKDGCEINTQSGDVKNCGGCGNACSAMHGTPSCAAGACQIACAAGFGDCDQLAASGCEIDLNSDVTNCGACKNACALAHATARCGAGACAIAQCDIGYADCNADPKDGCEVNLLADAVHCGACPNACSTNHGAASCANGACAIACNAGFADCNAKVSDGCEISLLTDVANCAACGNGCNGTNGTPSCVGGACQIACAAGFANCDNAAGNGCEIDLRSDVKSCGSCGNACALAHATARCGAGACAIAQCDAGFADCNGNPADGCEVSLLTDALNCNACGTACSTNHGTASCTNGACAIACSAGFANCNNSAADGCEISVLTDTNNCAACGNACSGINGTPSCAAGSCQIACSAGWGNCDGNVGNGCELSLLANVNNCGTCGRACAAANGTPGCAAGACTVAACNAGFGNCDNNAANGCEVNLNTNVSNCGACGSVCSPANGTGSCVGGACTVASCNAGRANCDNASGNGCEVTLATDVNNCGSCGTACAAQCVGHVASTSCAASACGVTACSAGWFDVDNQCANGCECAGPSDGDSCGAVTDLGAFAGPGNSISRTSTLLPIGREIWYRVQFVRASALDQTFHPHITFATNPVDGNGNPQFSFELRSDCNTTMGCAEGGAVSTKLDWEEFSTAGDPASPGFVGTALPGAGGVVYIRVLRNNNVASCDSFKLVISE